MRTRQVGVYVFRHEVESYQPLVITFSINVQPVENLEFKDHFLTDKSLPEVLDIYTKKVEDYAKLMDRKYYYRIVIRDYNERIYKIFKR